MHEAVIATTWHVEGRVYFVMPRVGPPTTGTLPNEAISTTPHLEIIKDQALAGIGQKRTVEETPCWCDATVLTL
jgi:hypothetical protein